MKGKEKKKEKKKRRKKKLQAPIPHFAKAYLEAFGLLTSAS
jgi:hypothetical protein